MYKYSEKDKKILKKRTSEFKYQVERRLNGDLTEDEFKPLETYERVISSTSCIYAKSSNSLW